MQGPAVWALRAQTDKLEYARLMRGILEATPNLALREGMAVDVALGPNDQVTGVKTLFGLTFKCRAAVVTTGTFMNGRIWVGRASMPAGRQGPSAPEPALGTGEQGCPWTALGWPAAGHHAGCKVLGDGDRSQRTFSDTNSMASGTGRPGLGSQGSRKQVDGPAPGAWSGVHPGAGVICSDGTLQAYAGFNQWLGMCPCMKGQL